jgi:23S rRNA pseudouridine1911/1915/1917 synthase
LCIVSIRTPAGFIIVAKNDVAHRKLSEMFSGRHLRKVYIALVHGWPREDEGTINLPISRDITRRTRMTTKRPGGRHAVSNWRVLERLDTAYGKFALLEVHIETGRTHQIRVHMHALGHPVVGDTLYGAPQRLLPAAKRKGAGGVEQPGIPELSLDRNFLHAAELEFVHPRTGATLALNAELPAELVELLEQLRGAELIP